MGDPIALAVSNALFARPPAAVRSRQGRCGVRGPRVLRLPPASAPRAGWRSSPIRDWNTLPVQGKSSGRKLASRAPISWAKGPVVGLVFPYHRTGIACHPRSALSSSRCRLSRARCTSAREPGKERPPRIPSADRFKGLGNPFRLSATGIWVANSVSSDLANDREQMQARVGAVRGPAHSGRGTRRQVSSGNQHGGAPSACQRRSANTG
jgi:hypothetical protein